MNDWKFIRKICKETEEKFGCICYAYNSPTYRPFWNICVDDYDLYRSEEFKEWTRQWHNTYRANYLNSFSMVFCYCNPIEENLWKYAQENRLIIID